MKTLRLVTIVAAALAVLFLLSALTVAAAPAPTNINPVVAAVIDNQSHTIGPNMALWYRFDYAGDRSGITITLPNGALNGLAFEVMTASQAADWWEATPVGRGSTSGNDLDWVGNFNLSGTYYVEVVNNTSTGMSFQLMITGSGVTLTPAPAPATTTTTTTTTTTAAAPAPAAAALMGNDPNHPLAIDNASHTIAANATVWYSFMYTGDRSKITIVMPNGTSSGVTFAIWTPDRIANWFNLDPIGRGTAQRVNCVTLEPEDNGACASADLNWTGDFDIAGTYYVQVVNGNSTPAAFTLNVQGTGVTLK